MNGAGSPQADAETYFQAIEERFTQLRGAPLVLSPADWQLAAAWRRQGIPLPVVLRAIGQVFATAAARGRRKPVLSLAYCRHEVEAEFARWRDAVAGGQSADRDPRRPPADRRLETKADKLASRCAGWPEHTRPLGTEAVALLRSAAADLRRGENAEVLEDRLSRSERALLERVAAALDPGELAALEAECRARLEPYRTRMMKDEYLRTLCYSRHDALRRRLGLPRLSLLSD